MTCISRLQPTTVVLVLLLPTKFLRPSTQMELPLMKMVASRIGGQKTTMQPLKKKHKRSLSSLMVKNLTAQGLTEN